MKCHLPGVIWDIFRLYYLHIGKSSNQPFLRAGDTQVKNPPNVGRMGCVCWLASQKMFQGGDDQSQTRRRRGAHFIWRFDSTKKWTWNATYLGLFGTYLGFIFYILENRASSICEGWWYTGNKNPPNLGRMGCVCWLPSQKRLDVLFSNM